MHRDTIVCVCVRVCVCARVCVCVCALRVRIFGSFKLEDALPDLQENHWGFHVDPLEPNRVWWMSRPQGTHTGPLSFPYESPKSLPSLPGCYSESYDAHLGIHCRAGNMLAHTYTIAGADFENLIAADPQT